MIKERDKNDAKAQDAVATARMLAYMAGHKKDYSAARKLFLTAANDYKGSGAKNPDYGSIPDQAAYQAAVCLQADGKTEEAKKAYRDFLRERPLSPLIQACFRRLKKLNGGTALKSDEALAEAATAKQEAHMRFEMSVCGPKAIAYMLKKGYLKADQGELDYKAIAKLCGTTDKGTTVEQMRDGLKKLGIMSYGVQLNRKDFAVLSGPAILLQTDHYLAVLRVEDNHAVVYDSRYGGESNLPLPNLDDTTFVATLIVFAPPALNEETR